MIINNKTCVPYITALFFLLILGIGIKPINADESIQDCSNIPNALDRRLCDEQKISKQSFVLIPYKPNYFIGSHLKDIDKANPEFDNFESKFQISFKSPLSNYDEGYRCLWIENTRCYTFFGYTQLSVWQMVNFGRSAPFRDTNFEPELMVAQLIDKKLFADWRLRLINYGLINHQSNGKSPPFSRSWNRSYIDVVLGDDKNYITFKYWKRWSENQKTPADIFVGDDNPMIEDYVGNAELKYFHAGDINNYSIVMRDSKNNSNGINYEINWSYPLNRRSNFSDSDLRFYVQYFNGYGETLIDYDIKRERIGVGLMLTDWL